MNNRVFNHTLREQIERLGELGEREREVALAQLDKEFLNALLNTWEAKALPHQVPPKGNWSTWFLLAGRGAGKGYSMANIVHKAAQSGEHKHILIVAPTHRMAIDNCVLGPSGICSVAPPGETPKFNRNSLTLEWANGAKAYIHSAEKADRIRGANCSLVWYDEIAFFRNAEKVYAMASMANRLKSTSNTKPLTLISSTPKPIKLINDIICEKGTSVTRGTSYQNPHLAPEFIEAMRERYEGTLLGRQELYAEILDLTSGLFSQSIINDTRVEQAPELEKIVVAVDPAVSTNKTSDKTGIVVAGMGVDQHIYVLEDCSGKYQPREWADLVSHLYHKWNANLVVVEKNQGGQLVQETLKQSDSLLPTKMVHAKTGKLVRAEPVSLLYEQKKIHMVGTFEHLELELVTYEGSGKSPDRMDAFVYACLELASKNAIKVGNVIPNLHKSSRWTTNSKTRTKKFGMRTL